MLTRIVKLTLKAENISSFEKLFDETHKSIRNFKGCVHLELFRDTNDPRIFFTYSKWKNVTYLEAYRHSEFFKSIWAKTKPLFEEKAQAWSVESIQTDKEAKF